MLLSFEILRVIEYVLEYFFDERPRKTLSIRGSLPIVSNFPLSLFIFSFQIGALLKCSDLLNYLHSLTERFHQLFVPRVNLTAVTFQLFPGFLIA